MKRLEAIGYWFDDAAPNAYPRPHALVRAWSAKQRRAVAKYLRAGALFESYRSRSFCRFGCGVPSSKMGHRDLFDGIFVWPEGLAHYVEAHSVRLPEHFVRHALAHPAASAGLARPKSREGLIDDAPWIAWGREHDATVDLGSWSVPDTKTRARIERTLASQIRAGHALWRGTLVLGRHVSSTTDEVVILLRDRRLAIVKIGRRTRHVEEPRFVAGWHAWNPR